MTAGLAPIDDPIGAFVELREFCVQAGGEDTRGDKSETAITPAPLPAYRQLWRISKQSDLRCVTGEAAF